MNANELAKKIENYSYWSIIDFHYIKESAEMLRQQQAEILAGKIMIKGYSKTIDEQQAEIEMLEAELKAMREQLNANQV